MRRIEIGFVLTCIVGLVACASDPRLDVSSSEEARTARTLLQEAAAEGPVLLDTNQPPLPLTTEEVGSLAAEGIQGLSVPFTTARSEAGDPGRRLVLRFVDKAVLVDIQPCAAPKEMPAPELQFLGLAAAFCEGRTRIAEVAGPSGGASPEEARRLVWRATGQLFPDDYEQSYGLRRLF
ncbi:MAG: hypothetical protein AAFY56_10015 [Pseudomonadota bacterium]